MRRPRAAIYGGTFDPVHNGHLEVARGVRQLFELDEVIFVPACIPPHKKGERISSAFHRFAMLALATQNDQGLRISTIELDQPDRPYAVETVERLQTQLGATRRLFFLIGADSWAEIQTWYEWQRLLRLCDVIVVTRPGYRINEIAGATVVETRGMGREEISGILLEDKEPRVFFSDAAAVDVSATVIRAETRSQNREALGKMLPATVADFILKYKLYVG